MRIYNEYVYLWIDIYTLMHTLSDSGIHVGLQEGKTALQIALDRYGEVGEKGDFALQIEEVVAVLQEQAKGGEEQEQERVVCRDCKYCWCSRGYTMEEEVEEGDEEVQEETGEEKEEC